MGNYVDSHLIKGETVVYTAKMHRDAVEIDIGTHTSPQMMLRRKEE